MSENQQPLDEEQAVSDVQEQETLPAAAEDTLPAAQDENAPAILDAEPEEEEEDIDPADVKIFGMKRHVFQLTCLGAAVGYILDWSVFSVRRCRVPVWAIFWRNPRAQPSGRSL